MTINRISLLALLTACSLAAVSAQTPPAAPAKPAVDPNAFPGDTHSVPVLPSRDSTTAPDAGTLGPAAAPLPLPGDDRDPVRSPDDPVPETAAPTAPDDNSSSSLSGLESLLPPSDDEESGKKKKHAPEPVKQPTQQEASAKDIQVGSYYLDTKNWKGALSRFESALILDPENPDVFWGLAEANRHLGQLADARTNYEKVVDFDPESRHGKDARKALKEPEIANGKNAPPAALPAETSK